MKLNQKFEEMINDFESLTNAQLIADISVSNIYAVDGAIIGTGQADYTKDSTEYNLFEKDKKFCLIDVPGIEGNEQLYEKIIQKSLDKAHVIIYVAGANKKIEPKTIEKLKKYLKKDTEVYFVCNVHCMPKLNRNKTIDGTYSEELNNAYKLAESSVFEQSEKELKALLGKNYKEGFLINGLQGLSSVAFYNGDSTLVPDTEIKKLQSYQNKYISEYDNRVDEMLNESHLSDLWRISQSHVENYEEHIIKSNVQKFLSCLNETSEKIVSIERQSKNIISKLKEPYYNFITSCEEAKKNSDREIDSLIQSTVESVIENEINAICKLIDEKNGKIKQKEIEDFLNQRREEIEKSLNLKMHEKLEELSTNVESTLNEAIKRFKMDIDFSVNNLDLDEQFLDSKEVEKITKTLLSSLNYNMKDFGKDFWKISFIISGAFLGKGLIGTVVGGIIGGVAMIGFSILRFFQTKNKRIATAKKNAEKEMYHVADSITNELEDKINLEDLKNKNQLMIDEIKNKSIIQKDKIINMVEKISNINKNIEKIKETYRLELYGEL